MKKILILAIALMSSIAGMAQDQPHKTITEKRASRTTVKTAVTTDKTDKNAAKESKRVTVTTVETKKTEVKSGKAKDTAILKPTKKGPTYYIDERGVKTYVGN
jgi:Ni/Co efflux regulator RcnB